MDQQRSGAWQRPASRLAVGVVSAGRVGSVVGAALTRAGHRVVAASAVSDASRERAARHLPGAEILSPPDVVAAADLVLIAVPDDAIAPLVASLEVRPGQIWVHTSGALGADVLRPARDAGALTVALAPAMTFTGRDEDLERLAGISWAVTGEAEARFVGEALVLEMGGEPEHVDEADRPRYHAALVYAANHLMTLVNDAADQLRAIGVANPERLMEPLVSASLDNALRHGDAALTGPVSRGDAGTVAKHLKALEGTGIAGTYRAMARRTAERALDSGRLRSGDAEGLLDVLAHPDKEETP
ncbi:Rossmann-like and DUF2520 domain-containing protein [Glycomyces albidus]|jgi:predicted short-subunit dehydrogenase-like oxidoreductase (DUF2520 family)|uniref:DUF2520 domain-containing protein n=1 Tax=Glycomyces albidus TaxID=2656774 RepID=A0A6L5GAD5_9ACTN|nr:DUF2520 domain-containing protein [Glycomyces albidus]MQM26614.1 DUF2520 domain-containing protein [Glycomyces albidus]